MDTCCAGPSPNRELSRRELLNSVGAGLGGIALAHLLNSARVFGAASHGERGALGGPHFPPKAKRVIYLFMSGGPSQLETFDYKPLLNERNGQELPESVRMGQRLTPMSGNQAKLPLAGSLFKFGQHGQSGAWVSELLPHTAKMIDELCFVRSMYTEAINHDPAITFFQTGAQLAGRPSFGSWLSYGLGSMNRNLPAFVVLISRGSGNPVDQPLYDRLWGSGFLPSKYQGVKFRSVGDPVLFLSNPPGFDSGLRRQYLDALGQ